MILVKPSIQYKKQIMNYRKEFIENNDDMAGTSYLRDYEIYEDWLKFALDNENLNTKHTEVTANVFLAINEADNTLLGMINIRHQLNDYLFNYGGHIGYSVKKFERRKGYAKEMLKLALQECKKIGIDKVLITCDIKNAASAKTIRACGGILENEVPEDDSLTQRYWIEIPQ